MELLSYDEAIKTARSHDPTDTAIPVFYVRPVLNKKATEEQGREIYDEKPYVEVITPGDPSNKPNRPVQDEDKKRWPLQWDAFQKGMEAPLVGTPVEVCSLISKAIAAELRAMNIRTVEAFAFAPEQVFRKLPTEYLNLRKRCEAWMNQDKALTEAEAKIKVAQARIAELEEKLAAAMRIIESRAKPLEAASKAEGDPKASTVSGADETEPPDLGPDPKESVTVSAGGLLGAPRQKPGPKPKER